jgi:hypothetical protein
MNTTSKFSVAVTGILAAGAAAAYSLAAPPSATVSLSPASANVAQGSAHVVTDTVTASGASGRWSFAVTGLPVGVTAGWSSNPAGASNPANGAGAQQCAGYANCYSMPANSATATLTLTTAYDVAVGTYQYTVLGIEPNGTTHPATGSLIVQPVAPFAISGSTPATLALGGAAQPVNLSLTNPYDHALTVDHLNVAIASVTTSGGVASSCGSSNFSVTQMPSTYSLTVPANSTRTLSQLGSAYQPSLRWVDLPVAQNGCIGVTLHLTYSGNGAL